MSTKSISTKIKLAAGVAAVCLAMTLGTAPASATTLSESAQTQAACNPWMQENGVYAGANYFHHIKMNKCAYIELREKANTASGWAGVAGLIAGWIPGPAGKSMGAALGVGSMIGFFNGNKIYDCTNGLQTSGAEIIISRGVIIGCDPMYGGGGMSAPV